VPELMHSVSAARTCAQELGWLLPLDLAKDMMTPHWR